MKISILPTLFRSLSPWGAKLAIFVLASAAGAQLPLGPITFSIAEPPGTFGADSYIEATITAGDPSLVSPFPYDGWCVDSQLDIYPKIPAFGNPAYNADIYSSLDPASILDPFGNPVTWNTANLDLINFILNQFDDGAYSAYPWDAVQQAIWFLLEGSFSDGGDYILNTPPIQSLASVIVTQAQAPVAGGGGEGFTPGCGDVVGLIVVAYERTTGSLISGEAQSIIIPVPLACLGDFVWEDLDFNGTQDPGEPGIPNVEVRIFDCSDPFNPVYDVFGNEVLPTTTDASGFYSFENLPAGCYTVEFVTPGGFLPTTANVGDGLFDSAVDSDADELTGLTAPITLGPGDVNLDVDAGFYRTGSIGDTVWWDVNQDGFQDDDEPTVAGIVVNLLDCSGNPILDEFGDPVFTETNTDGLYLFAGLAPGCYQVEFVNTDELGNVLFAFTQPNAPGVDDAFDSDADRTDGRTGPINLASGQNDLTWDAGIVLGRIGDFVWEDLNGDGLQDPNEPGIEGVTVVLLNAAGDELATTTTDENGKYLFDGLFAGDYSILVDPPAGLNLTLTLQGDDRGLDSNTNPSAIFALDPEENPDGSITFEDLTIDFGFVTDCAECEGKVDSLRLAYVGDKESVYVEVVQKKDGIIVFDGTLNAAKGYVFDIMGADKKGTLGTEIIIYIDGQLHTKIHTSCSQPIGPGLLSGDFLVLEGTSRIGGILCPVDTPPDDCACNGKVDYLKFEYTGPGGEVKIKQKDGTPVFGPAAVATSDIIEIFGQDKNNTLGTEISIYVDGHLHAEIHTSCSQPIGPGLVAGDFVILEGTSRNGGDLCPIDYEPEPPVDDCECDGKVDYLELRYDGTEAVHIAVVQKDGTPVFGATVDSGVVFGFSGLDKKGTLGTEINIYLGGRYYASVHTSCSQPIGPGLLIGDLLTVVYGTSRNGGELCPIDEQPPCKSKKSEKSAKSKKSDKNDKSKKSDKSDKSKKSDKDDKSKKSDKSDKSKKSDKNDKSKKSDKDDKSKKSDKNDKSKKSDKNDKSKKSDKNDKSKKSDKDDKSKKSGK